MNDILKGLVSVASISTLITIIMTTLTGEFNNKIKKVTGDSQIVIDTNDTYVLKEMIFITVSLIAFVLIVFLSEKLDSKLDINICINLFKKINIIYVIAYIISFFLSIYNIKKKNSIYSSKKVSKFRTYKYDGIMLISIYVVLNLLLGIIVGIMIKCRENLLYNSIHKYIKNTFKNDTLFAEIFCSSSLKDVNMKMLSYVLVFILIIFITVFYYIMIIQILSEFNLYIVICSFKRYKFSLSFNDNKNFEEYIKGYLIGEADGFYKIKKEDGQLVYINKGEIKEMCKIEERNE